MLPANFSFFSLSVFYYWSWDVHNPSLLSEGTCNPMCLYTYSLFKFTVLSKDQAGFPNEKFFQLLRVHGKSIFCSSFSSYYKNLFCLLTFYFYFIFSYFVNLTSLMQSHIEQCFYYKNYTSILKEAFNIQISYIQYT